MCNDKCEFHGSDILPLFYTRISMSTDYYSKVLHFVFGSGLDLMGVAQNMFSICVYGQLVV